MDFNGIDLNLLAAFDALMAERNVTRAATRVNVSQPAMSAALARLRTLFDDRLFQRSANGLLPTPRAFEVAEPISRALRGIETVLLPAAPFDPATAAVTFKLGMSDYPAFVLLPPLLRELTDAAPGVDVDVRAYSGRDEAVALLDAGKIDVAVSIAPTVQESRIRSRPILRDEFVTLVRRDARPARAKLDMKAYLSMRHLLVRRKTATAWSTSCWPTCGRPRPDAPGAGHAAVQVTLQHMFAVPGILHETGLAATTLRRVALHSARTGDLMIFPPPVPLPEVAFHLIWHQRNEGAPAQQWLREAVCRTAAAFDPAP
ncbi:hypothetical protein Q3G72_030439 [Acer saccharum]|nr:hypothetical protein Q3G72_030439 [Acer saccharum]